jgi:hypothetical protein
VPDRPGTAGALLRMRCFGDHVRNAERFADGRAEPVGGLVVQVIGEPEVRPLLRGRRAPLRGDAFSERLALPAQRLLPLGLSVSSASIKSPATRRSPEGVACVGGLSGA